jgi:aminopeptidase N
MRCERVWRRVAVILATVLIFAAPAPAWAQRRQAASEGGPARRGFAGPDAPRQPERVRTFDVKHIKAELSLDAKKKEVRGTVTHTIAPLHPYLTTVELDCSPALKVSAVTAGADHAACKFEQHGEKLTINLDRPRPADEDFDLAITYSGSPARGLNFITPEEAYTQKPLAIWTMGQPESNHAWLPCYDYPNDRATSEMIITVAKPLYVVSNGALIETKENSDGTITYHWKMDLPHSSYLISLAASDFAVYHDKVGSLPVDYYVAKSVDEAMARRSLGKTPRMIAFLGELIGTPYPYNKYAQVAMPEYGGGMENISATTLTDTTLSDAISALERDNDDFIAHELAHQWFGDLLTCRSWSHIWLNEGFASYFAARFIEHDKGDDAFRLLVDSNLRGYQETEKAYHRPIINDRYSDPWQMFDPVTYNKGASILHCLRGLVGDEAWTSGIRAYVRKHRAQVVSTGDFQKAMEAASGQDLKWFFDQWTTKAGYPQLKARWRYETADNTVRLHIDQVQKVDETIPLFRLPTTVELTDESHTQSIPIVIEGASSEFVIASPSIPKMVQIDPKGWLIKELEFDKTPDEWIFQLEHDPIVIGRLDAARALGQLKDDAKPKAVKALSAAWAKEKDPTARARMLSTLANGDETSRDTLLKGAKDRDARVRVAALNGLAKLKKDEASETLLRSVWADAKEAYGARVAALEGLVGWKVDDQDALLAAGLKTQSQADRIASAALGQIVQAGGPPAREAALVYSKYGQPVALRGAAVRALGRLAKDDTELQDALIALIDDQSRFVRQAAFGAVTQLELKRAVPALQARLDKEEPVVRPRLEGMIARLKESTPASSSTASSGSQAESAASPSASAADPTKEIADLERQAADLELQAKERRNRAEAVRLKAERAKLAPSSKP